MPAGRQINKIVTALAGEYLVAGQLCLRGFYASLSLKNYPKVDIFCLNPSNDRQATVQVKTVRRQTAYFLPEHIEDLDPVIVFVNILDVDNVDYYVVPAADVARISESERDEYLRDRPNVRPEQPRMISLLSLGPFKDRWDLVGLD